MMQELSDKLRIQQLTEENQTLLRRIDELMNLVMAQREEIQHLRDEIAILKKQTPRPKIPPSSLEGPNGHGKGNRGVQGSPPRLKKTSQLKIHSRQRIKATNIPAEAVFKGFKRYTVQDLIFASHNTVYELERWKLPDGTYITGQLPENIQGHYGPGIVAYVLHQYYGCRVTEQLLLVQLREAGILISEGQLNNILISQKDSFHQEKEDLLSAGIRATNQVKVDDTGARHNGKNGYTTVVGNEFFTYIATTDSKSRVNFFKVLHGKEAQYLINEDIKDYIESLKPGFWLSGYLLMQGITSIMNQTEWDKFLLTIMITTEKEVKLATEAALYAGLLNKGIPKNLGVHGDDAGQFNTFVRSLCWIHEERHYRKIIPANEKVRQELEEVRAGIWEIYKELKEYREAPTRTKKEEISRKFDEFFKKKTSSPTLNNQLTKTYAKKEELLRVLERSQTPLHNNGTETDAREVKVKLKVSGGTRSEEGKKCRDSFISLKKTCHKLGINFLNYLQDRVYRTCGIPPLAKIIEMQSSIQACGP